MFLFCLVSVAWCHTKVVTTLGDITLQTFTFFLFGLHPFCRRPVQQSVLSSMARSTKGRQPRPPYLRPAHTQPHGAYRRNETDQSQFGFISFQNYLILTTEPKDVSSVDSIVMVHLEASPACFLHVADSTYCPTWCRTGAAHSR